jgi:hypothetical protein
MLKMSEREEVIEIRSYLPTSLRILFFLLAFFPLLAPYELLIQPNWYSIWNVFFLFAAVISAGALAVSALLFWAAVAGLNSKLVFDKTTGIMTYSVSAPIVRWRSQQHPIQEIAVLRVEKHDWSDGAPSYSFQTQLADGSVIRSGSSWSKEEIEDIVQRVSAFLGISTPA